MKCFILFTILLTLLTSCRGPIASGSAEISPTTDGVLDVVATTSIVGDVVAQIGGDHIHIRVLLPAGADPHSYSATPQDAAALSDADVIFANGAGLETFLQPLLESSGATDRLVEVSNGIELQKITTDQHADEGGFDPHTWTDPHNVKIWVKNICQALSKIDPENAALYQANADAYNQRLDELDTWIREQVNQIPQEKRVLVTDHMILGYFARAYGFTVEGALIPGYSTLAEPSAKELAQIEDAIRNLGVKAVLVGNTVNPSLAERVAEDTGTQLVYIYTGSLGPADSAASTYLDYMRYNVTAIVKALK